MQIQGFKDEQIGVERYLNLRYDGTDVPVMTPFADGKADPAKAFKEQYKREFGFVLEVCLSMRPLELLQCNTHDSQRHRLQCYRSTLFICTLLLSAVQHAADARSLASNMAEFFFPVGPGHHRG